MRLLFVLLLIFIGDFAFAQNNVGINTNTPKGVLEIKDPAFSDVIISSDGYISDTTALVLRNMTSGGAGTEFIFESRREEGLFIRSNSDLTANRSDLLTLKPQGQIGIGVLSPAADLHVVGSTTEGRMIIGPDAQINEDSELFFAEERTGVTGVKLHYNGTSNRLEFRGVSSGNDQGLHLMINRDNGRIGTGGIINPQAALHIAGDVRITDLVGVGNRNIITDANGKLIAGPAASTISVYSVNPSEFKCRHHTSGTKFTATGYGSAEYYSGGDGCSGGFVAPLQLNHGDQISQVKLYFTDGSGSKRLRVSIMRRGHLDNGATTLLDVFSFGDNANNINASIVNTSIVVDNTQYTYWLAASAVNDGSVIPVTWPSALEINSIVLQ